MIVCQCRSITDRQVRAAVDLGSDSLDDLADACGAGTDCRGCHETLEALLDEGRAARPAANDPRRLVVVAAA